MSSCLSVIWNHVISYIKVIFFKGAICKKSNSQVLAVRQDPALDPLWRVARAVTQIASDEWQQTSNLPTTYSTLKHNVRGNADEKPEIDVSSNRSWVRG